MILEDGSKYEGPFRSGNFNGQGTLTYADGDKYVGEFRDDYFNGHGTITYGPKSEWAGNKDVGEYRDDKQHGQGTYTYANGSKYVGQWKDGKRRGQGTFTHWGGRILEGIWENDHFLYTKKSSPTVTDTKSPLEKAKEQCAEIGFETGTEKFGDCVIKFLN